MKAYLFDLDGTLVDSLGSISYFANKSLKKFGMDTIPADRYKVLVGDGAATLVKRMIKEVKGDESLFQSVYDEYNTTYDNDFLYLAKPYDGIIDMLKNLKSSGHKIAIISNKPHSTTQKICNELFGDLIDICFGKREGYPVKPDPTSVYEVINKLSVKKSDCIYVGDTLTDMKTGSNAGIYTVGVLWGFRDENELRCGNPQKIVKTPAEILAISE